MQATLDYDSRILNEPGPIIKYNVVSPNLYGDTPEMTKMTSQKSSKILNFFMEKPNFITYLQSENTLPHHREIGNNI